MSIRRASREIWFRIEKDSSGYPRSADWETLAAEVVKNGFKLTSIPFFIKNVSWGDVVNVLDPNSDVLEFSQVAERSNHSTLRLLLSEDEEEHSKDVVKELEALGYLVDSDSDDFLAISIPPNLLLSEELDRLVAEREKGRWQIQAGFLAS